MALLNKTATVALWLRRPPRKFQPIELFPNETCIWEVTSRNYMDRNMVAEAWMQIARAMGGGLTVTGTNHFSVCKMIAVAS